MGEHFDELPDSSGLRATALRLYQPAIVSTLLTVVFHAIQPAKTATGQQQLTPLGEGLLSRHTGHREALSSPIAPRLPFFTLSKLFEDLFF